MKPTLLLLLALLAGPAGAQTTGPADTDFQSDSCAQCHMPVSSRAYAAQIVGTGRPLFFDDVGCLVQYERNHTVAPAVRYVRSASGDAWLAADQAVWVMTKAVRTPMGYGLHAFADRPAAEAFARDKVGAKVVAWADLPALVPVRKGMM